MSTIPNSATDLGVLFVLGTPPTTIYNIAGTAITPIAINAGVWQTIPAQPASVPGSPNLLVRGSTLTYFLSGFLASGNILVQAEVQRVDPANPTLWSWATIQTVRGDSGFTQGQQSILSTDLVAIESTNPGNRQDVVLQTDSQDGTFFNRLSVQFQQANAGTDYLVIAACSTPQAGQ